MSDNTTPDATEWTDDRARQDTLPNPRPRAERETRIDDGASEEFADDRNETTETDAGEQASIGIDAVGDGQVDLTGETAGEAPEWAEGER